MKKSLSVLAALVAVVLTQVSCQPSREKAVANARQEVLATIDMLKKELPFEIAGGDLLMASAAVEGDLLVVECELSQRIVEAMLGDNVVNSDRNYARIISNVGDDVVDELIDAGFGVRMVYRNRETRETVGDIVLSPAKLLEIREKVAKGEIRGYSWIELAHMEFARMELPVQLEEGVWLTDAYIEGRHVYYVGVVEEEIDPDLVSRELLQEIKEGILLGLREEEWFALSKNDILKENVRFTYIYKDVNGTEWARIDIDAHEIF